MELSLEENLLSLTSNGQWQEVLDLESSYPLEEKTKFLWAWPNIHALNVMQNILNENGVKSILSIGCGSGLLEWIIYKSIGFHVTGLELDRSWWSSMYSPKTFIDLSFTAPSITSEFLRNCAKCKGDDDYALLFCYFNNREAFLDYMSVFTGSLVVIVGPKEGQGIVTDPIPLNPQFVANEECKWCFIDAIEMQTKNNVIAFYKKKNIDG